MSYNINDNAATINLNNNNNSNNYVQPPPSYNECIEHKGTIIFFVVEILQLHKLGIHLEYADNEPLLQSSPSAPQYPYRNYAAVPYTQVGLMCVKLTYCMNNRRYFFIFL